MWADSFFLEPGIREWQTERGNIGEGQGSQDNEAHWYDGDRTVCLQRAENGWGCTEAQWLQSALQMAKTEPWSCRGHSIRRDLVHIGLWNPTTKYFCLHYVLFIPKNAQISRSTFQRCSCNCFSSLLYRLKILQCLVCFSLPAFHACS